jgi:hypothetical protein
LVYISSHRIL